MKPNRILSIDSVINEADIGVFSCNVVVNIVLQVFELLVSRSGHQLQFIDCVFLSVQFAITLFKVLRRGFECRRPLYRDGSFFHEDVFILCHSVNLGKFQ